MKKSELKQIIREEIQVALEAEDPSNAGLKKAMGFEKPEDRTGNKMSLPLQKVISHIDDNILLPDVFDANASIYISSADRAKNWANDFMEQWGTDDGGEIRLKKISDRKYDVTNNKKYNDWKAKELKNIASFYDELKYKGD
jgi:hypothetical protein